MKKIRDVFALVAAVSGFVPKRASFLRSAVMLSSFLLSLRLLRNPKTSPLPSIPLFLGSTGAYMGFIYAVLSEKGLRKQFIKKYRSKEEAYQAYQTLLGFLFFLNGTSIGYVSASYPQTLPLRLPANVTRVVAAILFLTGWTIKIWSAKVVGADIYYWRDMFYGRRISEFVERGPYKILRNPMYGLGQLQSYATALWYRSLHGLVASLVYQLAVFSFYLLQEKKFIERVYLQEERNSEKTKSLPAVLV